MSLDPVDVVRVSDCCMGKERERADFGESDVPTSDITISRDPIQCMYRRHTCNVLDRRARRVQSERASSEGDRLHDK